MLPKVQTSAQSIKDYMKFIPEEQCNAVEDFAGKLKGLKVAHINATAQGGGVAEILGSLVSLMKGVGIDAEWYVVPEPKDAKFFEVTKGMHNALQGKKGDFLKKEREEIYLSHNRLIAKLMDEIKPDIWVVHDPQPLASIDFMKDKKSKKVARFHLDTSHPNKAMWDFVGPIAKKYDRAIFSMEDFVSGDFPDDRVLIFYPAIDPFSEKNRKMSMSVAELILENVGINITKPLISQVARFDPWKDPIGVVDAFYRAKNKIPGLQLALLGLIIASDDPEAMRIFREVQRYARGDPDIYLFAHLDQIKEYSVSTFVSAFQTASDVVLAKSIREGFGLVVTEAMWKGRPVIGGNVGGIKRQIVDGKSGFLVNSSDEAAGRMVELLKNSKLAKTMGREARKSVKENFLMPRLLLDYLKLFDELV